jgi:hypothetical protein
VPSARLWANGRGGTQKPVFLKLANGRYRAPDPFLKIKSKFIIRRIAADPKRSISATMRAPSFRSDSCARWDAISPHSCRYDRQRGQDQADLAKRPRGWLNAAAAVAAAEVREDYREWKRYRKKPR